MAQEIENAVDRTVKEQEEYIPPAPRGKRYVGYCRLCHAFVELGDDVACARDGHGRSSLAVVMLLDKDEPMPKLPRINVGALFMPALWGPLHGQIFTVLFYPIWLFLDNMIYTAVHGTGMVWTAVVASLMLAAFTVFYALRANEVGYLRVAHEMSPQDYVARERTWTVLLVLVGIAFLVFASWYNIAIRPLA